MLSRSVALFNRRVANIVPLRKEKLTELFEDSRAYSIAIVQNRTVHWLEVRGHCMDDVVVRDGSVYAQRPIKKGSTITVSPLYAKERAEECLSGEQECQSEASFSQVKRGSCFGHAKSTLLFCPLSHVASLKYATTGKTNASYQWGSWNRFNHMSRRVPPKEVVANHAIGITMDIVATENIAVGDEIVLDVSDGKLVHYGVELTDQKFPQEWRSDEKPAQQWRPVGWVPIKNDSEEQNQG